MKNPLKKRKSNDSNEQSQASNKPRDSEQIDEPEVYNPLEIFPGENSPILIVRHTVPNTDDPSTPCLTFRVIFLSFLISSALSFINQYFYFRTFPFNISIVALLVIIYPLGFLLYWLLPTHRFRLGPFKFYLNPGPFNIKEHALISIFCHSSTTWPYGMLFVTAGKMDWNQDLSTLTGLAFICLTQLIGFGLGGLLSRYLVDPANMVWPTSLVSINLLRTLHGLGSVNSDDGQAPEDIDIPLSEINPDEVEEEEPITPTPLISTQNLDFIRNRLQFKFQNEKLKYFLILSLVVAIYTLIPSYFFQLLSNISILCLISPNNKILNQLGSGLRGLGILSFSLDWTTITSTLGSPIIVPYYASLNLFIGFILIVWVIVPLGYYSNMWHSRKLPIGGHKHFNKHGKPYNVDAIIDPTTMQFNAQGYKKEGQLKISLLLSISYAANFAAVSSSIIHVIIYHGKQVMEILKSKDLLKPDIHYKLMKNYKKISKFYYLMFFLICLLCSSLLNRFSLNNSLGYWGIPIACGIGVILTIPNGIIYALTTQFIPVHVVAEALGGLIYPGDAVGNMIFKTYSFQTCYQAVTYLYYLKLGHYLKLPPRAVFLVIVVGTLWAALINTLVAYDLMTRIEGLCTTKVLHGGWSCEISKVFSHSSTLWGLVGTWRMFGPKTEYFPILYSFLIGFLLPVPFYFISRYFPFLKKIHIPLILSSIALLPPIFPLQYPSWFLLATVFNYYLLNYKLGWWSRYSYITSAALDCGSGFAFIIVFLLLNNNIQVNWWGNEDSNICPLDDQGYH